jgi:adenylate cyclase
VGRSEEAIPLLEQVLHYNQNDMFAHLELAATYVDLGREEDAKAEAAEVLRIDPKFSLESYRKGRLYKNPEDLERIIGALRKAGLPE